MKHQRTRYDITQCALYKCRSKKRLEHILTLQEGDLRFVDASIRYHKFKIDKKGTSEKRDITAPNYNLKQVQARILRLIQFIARPEWLISGEKGKSYIDNGKAHLDSNYFLAMDIRKFYDNCKRDYVYRFFHAVLQTSPDVAKILTDIVTYDGGIPTGCPTSQLIAYYAYQPMFEEISAVAKQFNCMFTLYVDDMTFSSGEPFSPSTLRSKVDIVLRKYGHKPKYKKVKYYSKNDFKPITGTIVTADHTLEVPNSLQKRIYDDFQTAKEFDSTNLSPEQNEQVIALKGRLSAVHQIKPNKFPQITQIISEKKVSPINNDQHKPTAVKKGRKISLSRTRHT